MGVSTREGFGLDIDADTDIADTNIADGWLDAA